MHHHQQQQQTNNNKKQHTRYWDTPPTHDTHTHTPNLNQVIKCDLFDEAVIAAVRRYPLMLLAAPQPGPMLSVSPLG